MAANAACWWVWGASPVLSTSTGWAQTLTLNGLLKRLAPIKTRLNSVLVLLVQLCESQPKCPSLCSRRTHEHSRLNASNTACGYINIVSLCDPKEDQTLKLPNLQHVASSVSSSACLVPELLMKFQSSAQSVHIPSAQSVHIPSAHP